MNRYWGDESWRQAAYAEARQGSFFGPEFIKQGNDEIVAAFRGRLKKVAGFGYVADPLTMRNSRNAIVYYLFLASPKPLPKEIIRDIFRKYAWPMCGRARLSCDVSGIKVGFRIPPERPAPNFAASWNVAPSDPLPVVRYDANGASAQPRGDALGPRALLGQGHQGRLGQL
jgi:hypothetical protein